MSHWNRLKVAFIVTVICVGVLMLGDMIFAIDLGKFIFSPVFFVPTFVAAYLLAPFIASKIPYKERVQKPGTDHG
jgi:hypothetical protein